MVKNVLRPLALSLTGTVPQILSLEIYPQYYTCMHIHVLYRWPLRLGLCKICRSKSFFLISLFFIENRSVSFKIRSRCLILQKKSATRVFSSTLKRLMPSFQPESKTSRDISLQRSLLMSNSPLVLWAHPPHLLPHREGAYPFTSGRPMISRNNTSMDICKGKSAGCFDLGATWRQHPLKLRVWRDFACQWFGQIRHQEHWIFARENQRVALF